MLERHVEGRVDWELFERLGLLGLDEIALKKGHRDFVVIVTARMEDDSIELLAVLPDRKKETVVAFLRSIPEALQPTVLNVCTDMYEGYVGAVREVLPSARVVVDRFHVASAYRKGADELRKQELRRLKKELPKEQYDELRGAMWAFRRNVSDLQPEGKALLERLFGHSAALRSAHHLREELTGIFETASTKSAGKEAIERWQRKVRQSGLSCFDSFLSTLSNWMEEITNYFLDRESSGFIEGLNNKIKVIKRRCYGIFNLSNLFRRIVLDLHGYDLFAPA
jgi:transposase